jgi:hypothetical protein
MSGPTEIRIDSLRDFRKILVETIRLVQRLEAESPGFPVYENIIRQLEAMSKWTEDDRMPTLEERNSIDVGLVAVRELEADPDPQVQDLCNRLYQLNSFFDDLTRN